MTVVQKREETIELDLKRIVSPFGYVPCEDLVWTPGNPYARAARIWWFARKGTFFETEAVCFPLRWRPRVTITVDMYGSHLGVDDLRRRGLEGNALGESPFRFQLYKLKLPMEELLGEDVALGKEDQWPVTFARLADEFARVHPGIWEDLESSGRSMSRLRNT